MTGGPRVRAVAGAPLVMRDGQALGAVVVLDTVPREWSARHLEDLAELADEIVHEVELRRALRRARRSGG